MSNWRKRLTEWMCKTFGHKFDDVEELMLSIKLRASNADKLDLSIQCTRCGEMTKFGGV